MRSSTSLLAVCSAVSLLGQAFASPSNIRQRDLESFIASERAIALQGVLNNIGDKGSKVQGASKGIIVASPSKADPDCKISSSLAFRNTLADTYRLLYLDSRCRSHHEDAG